MDDGGPSKVSPYPNMTKPQLNISKICLLLLLLLVVLLLLLLSVLLLLFVIIVIIIVLMHRMTVNSGMG